MQAHLFTLCKTSNISLYGIMQPSWLNLFLKQHIQQYSASSLATYNEYSLIRNLSFLRLICVDLQLSVAFLVQVSHNQPSCYSQISQQGYCFIKDLSDWGQNKEKSDRFLLPRISGTADDNELFKPTLEKIFSRELVKDFFALFFRMSSLNRPPLVVFSGIALLEMTCWNEQGRYSASAILFLIMKTISKDKRWTRLHKK